MNINWREKRCNRSIALTILFSMLVIALVPLLIMAIQGYHCASMAVVQLQTAHLDSVLHARKARITDWLQERKTDVTIMSEAPCTRVVCLGETSIKAQEERQKICALLDHAHLREPAYESLVVYSADWKRLESSKETVHQDDELIPADFREKLMYTFTVVITKPHVHENGVIAIHIGIPVFGDENTRIGYVVAALDLSVRLYPILEDRAGFGKTTHTYMLYQGSHYLSMSDSNINMPEKVIAPPPAILQGTDCKPEFYKNCSGQDVMGVSTGIGGIDWLLVAEIEKKEAFSWLVSLRYRAIGTGIISLIIVIMLALKYSKKITSPLLKLAKVANEISAGSFDKRLPALTGREPRNVAIAFNTMLDELSNAHVKLVQAAALSAIGELSSSIVHEMRNPLSSVKMNLKALQKKNADDEVYSELAEIALEQAARLEQMLNDLLRYGKPIELNKEKLRFTELAHAVVDAAAGLDESTGVKLCIDDNTADCTFFGDKEQLCRAITNLVDNGICASSAGAAVTVSGEIVDVNVQPKLIIMVDDTGIGIPDNAFEHLFEPFFTTRNAGTGLGLANVRKIIELHNGTVEAENHKDKGARFTVVLPL